MQELFFDSLKFIRKSCKFVWLYKAKKLIKHDIHEVGRRGYAEAVSRAQADHAKGKEQIFPQAKEKLIE